MKFFIYVRSTNEVMKDILVGNGKKYCLQSNLDLVNVYFDINIRPSSPKSQWKGFFKLIEEMQDGDCILCDRIGDLPPFFQEINPSLLVRCWGMQPSEIDREAVNFYLKNK